MSKMDHQPFFDKPRPILTAGFSINPWSILDRLDQQGTLGLVINKPIETNNVAGKLFEN